MRILITGSNGFLGQKFIELIKKENRNIEILGLSKSRNRNPYLTEEEFKQIDLTNFTELNEILKSFHPSHILHCAAITSVEACEENKELADIVNVDLTLMLGNFCKANDCHFTFISTDFVFDGNKGPYTENDKTNPVNYYGFTKLKAEIELSKIAADIAILRTILVYGAIADKGRSNLVLWAKSQLEQEKSIKVVADQWRMPTWVDDLAKACISSINTNATGIFHISGSELMTIAEAVEIIADTWNFNKKLISKISAKDIGQDKNRPKKTGFILDKAKNILNYTPTPFVVSLQQIKDQLIAYNR